MKVNIKADYLRINYKDEEYEDMAISETCKGYTRRNNTIFYYQELDNGMNELHIINLKLCDCVEVWEDGICVEIEEYKED